MQVLNWLRTHSAIMRPPANAAAGMTTASERKCPPCSGNCLQGRACPRDIAEPARWLQASPSKR